MDKKTIIDIIVAPKSSRSKISIDQSNCIKIYLKAPPIDGKANAELISLFAKTLKVTKSSITIIHGESGKKKRLSVYGLTIHQVMEMLKAKQ